jgi:hypothetical protein
MTKLIIIVAAIVVLIALVAMLAAKLRGGSRAKGDTYYLRKTLFSPAERSFLGVLEPLVPPEMRLFGKVRLEDIFGVKSGLDPAARTAARNRINRKHVDFLLVRADDLSPIAGIELDDRSHEAEDRQERDAFVDELFASGGIPLIHFTAQKAYAATEVLQKLQQALDAPVNAKS